MTHNNKEVGTMAKTLVPTKEGTSVELGFDSEAREAIALFVQAKQAKAEAEKVLAEIDPILLEKMGDAEFATVGGVKVLKIVKVARQDIDRKVLRENYAEVAKAITYDNPYQYLKAVS
jgi:hypothetical protein